MITDKQIRRLMSESLAVDDWAMAEICGLALAPSEHFNADGTPLVGPCGVVWTRTEARTECERVINEANPEENRP